MAPFLTGFGGWGKKCSRNLHGFGGWGKSGLKSSLVEKVGLKSVPKTFLILEGEVKVASKHP